MINDTEDVFRIKAENFLLLHQLLSPYIISRKKDLASYNKAYSYLRQLPNTWSLGIWNGLFLSLGIYMTAELGTGDIIGLQLDDDTDRPPYLPTHEDFWNLIAPAVEDGSVVTVRKHRNSELLRIHFKDGKCIEETPVLAFKDTMHYVVTRTEIPAPRDGWPVVPCTFVLGVYFDIKEAQKRLVEEIERLADFRVVGIRSYTRFVGTNKNGDKVIVQLCAGNGNGELIQREYMPMF